MYEEIFRETKQLTEDEFGNYVISHLLQNGTEEDKIYIIDEILDDLCQLSMHKSGSNVVEKCLKYSPEDRRQDILDRFCGLPLQGNDVTLTSLMENKFGNYVIQRVYDLSSKVGKEILVRKIS
jgi:hypothetical protein